MEKNADLYGRIAPAVCLAALAMVSCAALGGCGASRSETSASVAADPGATSGATVTKPAAAPYKGPVAFTVVAEGLSATFTDHSTGDVSGRQWVFGDGATSAAPTPVHVYPGPGTYEVTEAIVDAKGNATSRTVPVEVIPLPPELRNGVARPGLSAVSTYDLHFYARPPAGADKLTFEVTGATPDMDLYVKFGSVPTADSYDCLATWSGNTATCAIPTAAEGPYYARLLAKKNFADASLKASWDVGTPVVAVAAGEGKAQASTARSD